MTVASSFHAVPSVDASTYIGPFPGKYEHTAETLPSRNARPATSWQYTTSLPAFMFQWLELNDDFLYIRSGRE